VLPGLAVLGILKAFEAREAGTVVYVVLGLIAVVIRRPFCKYACAIGAASSLFNKFSLYKYRTLDDRCVKCGICVKKCPMGIVPYTMKNSPECIRCGVCKKACPRDAIVSGFFLFPRKSFPKLNNLFAPGLFFSVSLNISGSCSLKNRTEI
jgi:polyferredoxin